jgi:hypothetical protein
VAALVYALRRDLLALRAAARLSAPDLVPETSRPLLLVDDIDWLGLGFLAELLCGPVALVSQDGLNDRPEPTIPLVLALGSHPQAQTFFEQTAMNVRSLWAGNIELSRFDSAAEEDLSAYQQVLLNPYNAELLKDISDKRWVVQPDAPPETFRPMTERLRRWVKGIPADFENPSLYMWVDTAKDSGFVRPADDDEVLKRIRSGG